MAPLKLGRRSFLKGIGGAIVGLPFLEAMLDSTGRALAGGGGGIPKRYLVCFGGQSLGGDNDPVHNLYVPDTVGADYDLKTALAPLADHGNVKNEITVVSGLEIPQAAEIAPPGGWSQSFHINTLSPLFSGMRRDGTGPVVRGPTSDQIVADAIAGETTFKSLVYRVQAAWYLSVSAPYGRDLMSYRLNSSNQPVGIPATVSPQQAWDSLFTGFTPEDPAEAERRNFLLRQRKSVLDLVRGDYERVVARLGGADQRRMQDHFDEIRDLERRVAAISPEEGGNCRRLDDPGEDPAIGGSQTSLGGADYDVNLGYSDEDTRARVFCDLIHMAFACDLSRVGTLMFTMAQSHLNMHPLTGYNYDLHEIGHSSLRTPGVSNAIAWHMKHFGYLVSRFRDTPEGAGSMLDSMAIVMLHEGGHGFDPTSGSMYSSHSSQNMACLIAGRAGGLRPGRHVVTDKGHPAQVLITAMNAVGVPTTSLGEVSGTIPALLS
jgi:hypothetical protein